MIVDMDNCIDIKKSGIKTIKFNFFFNQNLPLSENDPYNRRVGKGGGGLRGSKSQEIFILMSNEIKLTLKRKIANKFLRLLTLKF